MKPVSTFDPDCQLCPRLTGFLKQVRIEYPEYHARPVPSFGDPGARLLIVGLAPGLHGANATGRPFTGDFAGILLYQTLYEHGFSNRPEATAGDDGLKLTGCRITNAVKCLPPGNKPVGSEITNCNVFLSREIDELPTGAVILALGRIAHRAVIKASGLKQSAHPFGHGQEYRLDNGRKLLDSYHCSRYNTQTGRLNEQMFGTIVCRARMLLSI